MNGMIVMNLGEGIYMKGFATGLRQVHEESMLKIMMREFDGLMPEDAMDYLKVPDEDRPYLLERLGDK
jgi:hypothetical protein